MSTEYRKEAIDYIRAHAEQVPRVVAIRVGRLWSVYGPETMVWYNDGEGREKWISRLGLWCFYPMMVLAIAGALLLRRSRSRLWPLLVVPVVVTVIGALTYGQVRFRAPAELSLVVLAAVAVDAAVGALAGRPMRSAGPDG